MPPAKNAHLVQFGRRVRSVRNSRGYSQEELAAAAGLHRTYIGMIERGEKNLTLLNILRVAEALGCAAAELLIADE